MSFDDIKSYSKSDFKALISSKIRKKAHSFLKDLQASHTKTKNLEFSNNMKSYLISTDLSLIEKQMLFKLKCKVVKCKGYYKTMYTDLRCIFFCELPNTIDDVEHYYNTCKYLSTNPKFKTQLETLTYSDLHGDLIKQITLIEFRAQPQTSRIELNFISNF